MKTLILKSLTLLALIIFGTGMQAQTPGKIMGKVKNAQGDPENGATVKALLNGVVQDGGNSDSTGAYSISNLEPGDYTLEVFIDGESEATWKVPGIKVNTGQTKFVDIDLPAVVVDGGVIRPKITFEVDGGTRQDIDHDWFEQSGSRGIDRAATQASFIFQKDEGEPLQVRGARPGGTAYYMDGMKLIGEPYLPQDFIGNVSVMGGGVPAEYGDFTGGVIVVTTRNPGMKPSAVTYVVKTKKEKKPKKHTEIDLMFNPAQG